MEDLCQQAAKEMGGIIKKINSDLVLIKANQSHDVQTIKNLLHETTKVQKEANVQIEDAFKFLTSEEEKITSTVDKMSAALTDAEKKYQEALLEKIIDLELQLKQKKSLEPLKKKRRRELKNADTQQLGGALENLEKEAANIV